MQAVQYILVVQRGSSLTMVLSPRELGVVLGGREAEDNGSSNETEAPRYNCSSLSLLSGLFSNVFPWFLLALFPCHLVLIFVPFFHMGLLLTVG